MSDLISRQAAIDIVSGYAEKFNGYIGSPNDSEVYAYARGLLLGIERNINAVPSADAVPVKHAKLVNPNPFGECSICGYLIDIRQEYNYCPNCGARMTTKTPIDKDELAY